MAEHDAESGLTRPRWTLDLGGAATVVVLLLFCAVLGVVPSCDDSSSSADAGTEVGSDVVYEGSGSGSGATACAQRGGTCVEGVPESDPPGFTVTCPQGDALDDGQTSTTNGGIDIINSSLALGCSRNPDGTTHPALCCLPGAE